MPKVLITGIAGQTGSHLADYIHQSHRDWEVHGTVRYRSDLSNISHCRSSLHLHDCELRDAMNVHQVIERIRPDRVFHLAATSFVRSSWDQPADVITNNVVAQINLLEAIRKYCPDARVQIAGSSEQFGKVAANEVPITERNELRPISPYAVSKCAQESSAYQYYQSYKLHTVITRTFNHTGPRRTDAFVESSFARQIAEIELGKRLPIIQHGNLDSVRDYTDARDIARAYWLAIEKCDPGVPYNICSNMRISIGDVLKFFIGKSHIKDIRTETDPSRLRPSDVILLYGDSTKFRQTTGWEPQFNLDITLQDLLDAWRYKLKNK